MADPNSHANDGTPLRGFPKRPRPDGPDDGGGPQPESMGRLVDFIARINLSVREKLLGGFILVVLLLSAMAILSLVVISQMNQKVESLTELQERFDISRQMIYHITGQSHFRAMALLTDDPSWNVSIDRAKQTFSAQLAEVQRNSPPGREDFFAQMEEANARFTQSSAETLALHLKGDIDQALALHLAEEHPISHDVEDLLNQLITSSASEWEVAVEGYESDRRLLTTIISIFAGVSIVVALSIGAVLSLSFSRPVRKIDSVLAQVTTGDFTPRARLLNRDEIGTLGNNLDHMIGELSGVYDELTTMNENLEKTVAEQVGQLENATSLKRYLSPQLAESIMRGGAYVDLASRRQDLTILFSDIRGFTAMSERMEPEELVDLLNKYLTGMTEIVFEHGGTLDKYIGDALMVFFGNPVPYDDHALRAVRTAFAMQRLIEPLQEEWFDRTNEDLNIGIGIATGYVTVGNIGSTTRADYTVIGNTVNLASRLAGKAAPGQILITERTLVAAREIVDATEFEQVELRGVSRPIRIYGVEESAAA